MRAILIALSAVVVTALVTTATLLETTYEANKLPQDQCEAMLGKWRCVELWGEV